jgi:hypothetical protein
MANSLIVVPLHGEARSYVVSQGLAVEDLPDGTLPSAELLVAILGQLDWPSSAVDSPSGWFADFHNRDGRYPPISEMSLADDSLSFRLGPLFGPWEVCRRVATACGPQVAIEGGGGGVALVTSALSFEDFHLSLVHCLPRADGRDREWSQPLSEEYRFRNAISELGYDTRIEDSLEYAFSGRIGCGTEAMNVGWAIQAYRFHPRDSTPHPRSLDDARYLDVLNRLRRHIANAAVPIPELVWAFGQAEDVRADLLALTHRLQDAPAAAETQEMAELFLRSLPR